MVRRDPGTGLTAPILRDARPLVIACRGGREKTQSPSLAAAVGPWETRSGGRRLKRQAYHWPACSRMNGWRMARIFSCWLRGSLEAASKQGEPEAPDGPLLGALVETDRTAVAGAP